MRLVLVALVLIAATFLGIFIQKDPGYALFAYRNWTLEMPLWLTLLLGVFILVISIFCLWMLNFLFASPHHIQLWWIQHKKQRSRLKTVKGLLALAEGRFDKAEKMLSLSAPESDAPVINYLSAARAAEERGAIENRDYYLRLAEHLSPESDIVVRLTQAQLQYKNGEIEKCIATLQHLHSEKPRHPQILKLLSRVYENTQDWHSLYAILPELRRAKFFKNPLELEFLEQKIYNVLLREASLQNKDALMKLWNHAPKAVKYSPSCIKTYSKLLLQFQEDYEAEKQLSNLLKQEWDSEAIHLYGFINASLKKQLVFAEYLLKKHPEDPGLLLCLGRLCLRAQLWGKAKDYLEASFNLSPKPETYVLLADLMQHFDDPQKRNEYYKRGLLLATRSELNIMV